MIVVGEVRKKFVYDEFMIVFSILLGGSLKGISLKSLNLW